jgi:hypothetical protein
MLKSILWYKILVTSYLLWCVCNCMIIASHVFWHDKYILLFCIAATSLLGLTMVATNRYDHYADEEIEIMRKLQGYYR